MRHKRLNPLRPFSAGLLDQVGQFVSIEAGQQARFQIEGAIQIAASVFDQQLLEACARPSARAAQPLKASELL